MQAEPMRDKSTTDLDLAPEYRTEASFWKAKYFEARAELVKANKGIRRLRRSLQGYKDGKQCADCLCVGCTEEDCTVSLDGSCARVRVRVLELLPDERE